MPRDLKLVLAEKHSIKCMLLQLMNLITITNKLKRSKLVVCKYIWLESAYRTKKPTGRPPKLSVRAKCILRQKAIKLGLLASQLKHYLKLIASVRTMQRFLGKDCKLVWRYKIKTQPINNMHKKKRLEFVNNNMHLGPQGWRYVLFSDEKNLTLIELMGINNIGWRESQQITHIFSTETWEVH